MRLFAGIPLDEAARAFVADAADRLARTGVSLKWVRHENWHVTVAFLGELAEPRVAEARQAFVRVAALCEPFRLSLAAIGAFPNLRRPRAVYVGGESLADGFARTAAAVRSEFTGLGFRFDDDAIAHVTIARSDGRSPIDAPALPSSVEMPVRRLVLFASVPAAGSVRYDEIESVDLRNP
ncbi:MAG TPA: RNA 2',3'-cyclic phosphodiesterase [Candidatus Eremiobacteraceae bacterium]|nr:RNA 2',3'-cyclic phosphodiesterase [Candidatus Eremiobacteraceae bacterium]